ncbi:MAG: hypothetical protein ACUVTD_07370 [Nitrososphaerales archaeon]
MKKHAIQGLSPTERMLKELPVDVRKVMEKDRHTQLVIRAEKKLVSMGYSLYSYDKLPKEVKDKLNGSPDVCAEKDGKWVFVEVSITRPPHIENYLRVGRVILVLPVQTSKYIEVWGEEELKA